MQDVLAGVDVTLSFAAEDRPGYFAIINADMELAELGWVTFPKLMHLGWAAQWLEYEGRLKANLSRPALEVPIFKEKVSVQFHHPSMHYCPCIFPRLHSHPARTYSPASHA